jgi:hypothetical protein
VPQGKSATERCSIARASCPAALDYVALDIRDISNGEFGKYPTKTTIILRFSRVLARVVVDGGGVFVRPGHKMTTLTF